MWIQIRFGKSKKRPFRCNDEGSTSGWINDSIQQHYMKHEIGSTNHHNNVVLGEFSENVDAIMK